MDWLKRDRPMALLREVLPPEPELPRRFDLLIIDEVHNVAPAGRGEAYGTDTLRTQAIRALAPHCQHKLFLSATPHNGYPNSFSALLELLDPFRFARGVEPDREQLAAVMVRRLKTEITDADGRRRFPEREITPLEVTYPPDEREAHAVLSAYADRRRARTADAHGGSAHAAADFSLMLLKKRLFLLTGGVREHAAPAPADARRPAKPARGPAGAPSPSSAHRRPRGRRRRRKRAGGGRGTGDEDGCGTLARSRS
jgi:hypothetical protein